MSMVTVNGVDRDYNKMTYGEQHAYDEGQRFAQQLKSQGFAKQARADASAALRALPDHEKHMLRRHGFQGDLSPLPPGQDSGVLKMIDGRTKSGHWVEKYEGDPRCWMNQFMPPKTHAIAFRRQNQGEASWQQMRVDTLQRYAQNNPKSNAASDLSLMTAFGAG